MTAAGGNAVIRAPRLGPLRRFITRQDGRRAPIYDTLQFAALSGLLVWLSLRGAEAMGYSWKWYMVPRYMYRVIDEELIWGPLMRGLFVTLEIGAGSLVLTVIIGFVAVLMRLSDSFAARALVRIYLEVIRNTPLLVQLFLFFYILAPIFGVDRFWTGVLALSFFEGAHAMEIFRAGILSVGRGQWEASDSLGLSTVDTYRFIVLPQALRLVLPPLTGLVITLVKHSAIVSAIAIADLTTEGRNVIADTFLSFEIWFTVAGMYLVLTIALSLLVSYLESRLRIRY
jgi:polar amino acid transport system permease protein